MRLILDIDRETANQGVVVQKPPRRTTWRGTPLHELWLEDPDGNLVEIYVRITDQELAGKPADLEPTAIA